MRLTNNNILRQIGKPKGQAVKIVKFHNTSDIIKQMQAAHYENAIMAVNFANRFKGRLVKDTCNNIFNFIKNNIEYRIEPADAQTTKTINRLISDGYGDCKHYSGFFASVLHALNIPFVYRFVSYTTDKTPTHVYIVAYDEKNQPIYCDAVLDDFNTEKNYTYKIDKKVNNMAVYHLSGFNKKQNYIGLDPATLTIIMNVAGNILNKDKKQAEAKGKSFDAQNALNILNNLPKFAELFSSFGPGDCGKDFPGGVVYYYKYVVGGSRYRQPVIKEPISICWYRDHYSKDIMEQAGPAGFRDFTEFEDAFMRFGPQLIEQAPNLKGQAFFNALKKTKDGYVGLLKDEQAKQAGFNIGNIGGWLVAGALVFFVGKNLFKKA